MAKLSAGAYVFGGFGAVVLAIAGLILDKDRLPAFIALVAAIMTFVFSGLLFIV